MREKRHTREGAVSVRERGIYIYKISVRERRVVGVRWSCRFKNKERRKKNRETKEMEFGATKKRLGRMFLAKGNGVDDSPRIYTYYPSITLYSRKAQ